MLDFPFSNDIVRVGIPVQAVQAVGWSRADWRLAWLPAPNPPNPPPA